MSLLVVGYPAMHPEHLRWIERARRQDEKLRHSALPPHITFVFSTSGPADPTVLQHLAARATGWGPIPFVLRSCLMMPDPRNERCYVFLVPEEGFSRIVRLHDRLYEGPLAAELRLDLPFVPHLTLGYFADIGRARRLASALNEHDVALPGTIQALTALDKNGDRLDTLAIYPL